MSPPPKLFFWSELYWPTVGGIETFCAAMLPRLAERGYDIRVLTSNMEGEEPGLEIINGIPVHRLPVRAAIDSGDPAMLLDTIGQVRRLKQEIGPCVMHLNFCGPMAFFHMRTAKVQPSPMVTTFHGTLDEVRRDGSLMQGIFAGSDWLIANSHVVKADINQAVPDATARTSVIYCGVEPSATVRPPDLSGPPRLLYVGRLIHNKGVDLALQAFVAVLGRYPDARLVIAGDGDQRAALEALAASLGIAGSVDFVGWIRPGDVGQLMAESTMVIMPSRWREPFGLVAVEAALQGRTVIGTEDGGLTEIIVDGVTGRLVPRNSADGLAEATIGLLSDRASLAAMGRKARERALRLFSLEASTDSHDALYRRMAASA
ncbi:glycosyltransferase family 4 protein [Emcibacter sp. SYSU 3D8]|uniref:glycosyltransferase family 4 protein n=1 Tax=Emcibacter sp. SYSU 3D8 TaxID=3133969 RepID=UPI0031FF1C9C